MNVGRLDKRVTVQERSPVRDSTGGTKGSDSWADVTTRWASIEPLRGRELFEAQRVNAELTHRITMRHAPGITPDMRVQYTDPDEGVRSFRIHSVIDVREARSEMQLICSELVE